MTFEQLRIRETERQIASLEEIISAHEEGRIGGMGFGPDSTTGPNPEMLGHYLKMRDEARARLVEMLESTTKTGPLLGAAFFITMAATGSDQ